VRFYPSIDVLRGLLSGAVDWVTSLFRRVLSLYENLPEEGGKKNTTGGKQEESVIKSIKSMLDLVCLHLSEPLFDLVLKLVYEYITANAKSNAVKAIGQMISSLALAHPSKTIDKFLPFCLSQIKDELKHGASSLRTTSSHVAIPSDTTLHWSAASLLWLVFLSLIIVVCRYVHSSRMFRSRWHCGMYIPGNTEQASLTTFSASQA
jgi:proteasome activator subunit 4